MYEGELRWGQALLIAAAAAGKERCHKTAKEQEKKRKKLFLFPVNGKDKRCIRGWPQNYFKVFLSAPGRRRYTGIKRMKKKEKN